MKNIISFLIISFCVTSNLFSQVDFGVIAGPNYSNAKFKAKNNQFPVEGTGNQVFLLGFHAGLLLDVKISDLFSIESNILYSQKGYRFTDPNLREGGKNLINYITVPITIGYQIFPKTTLQLGPELGYLVSSEFKTVNILADFSNLYNRNFSLAGLAGINYAFTDYLELGIRYSHGITRMNEDNFITITDDNGAPLGVVDLKPKSRVFQLSMRYRI